MLSFCQTGLCTINSTHHVLSRKKLSPLIKCRETIINYHNLLTLSIFVQILPSVQSLALFCIEGELHNSELFKRKRFELNMYLDRFDESHCVILDSHTSSRDSGMLVNVFHTYVHVYLHMHVFILYCSHDMMSQQM